MTPINKGQFNFLICLLYTGYRLYFPISVKGSYERKKNEELPRFEELSERPELGRLLWRPRKINKLIKTNCFVSPKNVIFIAIPDLIPK
jgi:hypothetical protein